MSLVRRIRETRRSRSYLPEHGPTPHEDLLLPSSFNGLLSVAFGVADRIGITVRTYSVRTCVLLWDQAFEHLDGGTGALFDYRLILVESNRKSLEILSLESGIDGFRHGGL